MTINVTKMQETVAELLREEIALANEHLSEDGPAVIRGEQWVVVSSLTTQRSVVMNESGAPVLGIQDMPTLFTSRDARALVKSFDGLLEGETVRSIHFSEYWKARLVAAVSLLNKIGG